MFFLKTLPTRAMIARYDAQLDGVDIDVATVEQALTLLRRASRLVRQLDQFFAVHGFSQLRFLILIVIDREPDADGLSPSEIADRLDVSRPVLTRTLGLLEREGLATRRPAVGDNRGKLVRLTDEGRARLHTLMPEYITLLQREYQAGER